VIARYFHQIGQHEFTPRDALNLVTEKSGENLEEMFPGAKYSNSPLHKGFHALSKGETKEVDEAVGEDGTVRLVDRFARGARGVVKKDVKVGLKHDGKYYTNAEQYPDFYTEVTEPTLIAACNELIALAKPATPTKEEPVTSGEEETELPF